MFLEAYNNTVFNTKICEYINTIFNGGGGGVHGCSTGGRVRILGNQNLDWDKFNILHIRMIYACSRSDRG